MPDDADERDRLAIERLRASDSGSERMAMVRRLGRPDASDEAIEALLDALDDPFEEDDPNDPPGYDWGSGQVVYPGSTLSVAKSALASLASIGLDRVLPVLEARIASASSREERARRAHHGVCLAELGPPGPEQDRAATKRATRTSDDGVIVRLVWPRYHVDKSVPPIDAFFLECRSTRVEREVIAHVEESRRAELRSEIARIIAHGRVKVANIDREHDEEGDHGELYPGEESWRRYGGGEDPWVCFFVSRDRRVIQAHLWTYPFGNLWNAYSPFRQLGPFTIEDLAALESLPLPADT